MNAVLPHLARGLAIPIARAVAAVGVALVLASGAGAAPPTPTDGYTGGPVVLTHTYHGSDGSLFSTRAIGNTVVGFSQDPSGQRTFVFKGVRNGLTIDGQYYGVPKGSDTTVGPLTLTVSDGGSTLTRPPGQLVGGAVSWIAKLPGAFGYPHAREAGFQSTAANDLDGAFKGADGSRIYVRQYGASQVVAVVERFSSGGTSRPLFASVVIAERSPTGGLTGAFYDLPHQTAPLQNGSVFGQKFADARSFQQNFYVGTPSVLARVGAYTADYAIDVDRFEQEIRDRMSPFVVGFSYAIAQDGRVVRKGAGGARRAPTATNGLAGPLMFEDDTIHEIASTSKTVTLVAVLKALRERGVSVDSPVSPFLPADWTRGPGMDTVTFRQLLSHGIKPTRTLGLRHPGNLCKTDFYGCLREAVAGGMTVDAGYNNIHYTIFRVILPFVVDPVGMTNLFLTELNGSARNEAFSEVFRTRIRTVLQSAGVDADFKYVYGNGVSGAYRYTWGTPPTDELYPLISFSLDDYLQAGSGGLKMSAPEYAQFLSRLEKGLILEPQDLAMAKAIGFGGTGPVAGPDGVGPLWTKNGGAAGVGTQSMVYPGTEVFVMQNSTGHPTQTKLSSMLIAAWKASLVGKGN